MKLKNKIIENRVGLLVTIGILLIVTIIVGISYAYFGGVEIKNNNTVSGNIATNSYIFTTNDTGSLSITLEQSKLDIANASNDYTSFMSNTGGNINVSLDTNGLKKVYCSYDLVYVPSTAYTANEGAVNAGLKELTLSGTSNKGNSFSEIDVSGSSTVTLISGINISTDSIVSEQWSFTVKYYNLDVIQDNVIGKTFKGNIKVANTDCSFNEPEAGTSFETLIVANNSDIFDEYGLRYEGADPNNYICLDNKTSGSCSDSSLLFRIIGLFNEDTSSDGTSSSGSKKLLKVIDTNNYGGTSGKYWNSAGTNNWSSASLKTELNGTYLTTLLGTSNVNSKLSGAIANAEWHLGGASSSNYKTLTAEGIYTEERNASAIYSGNPSSVYAKVGLMYPSDYGYATVGGTTTNKSSCRAKELWSWDNSSYSDCKNNDWLFTSQSGFANSGEWLLSPYSSNSIYAAYLNSTGYVYLYGGNNVGGNQFAVRPTFYLDSSILKIVGGDGTKDNAYRVG